MNNPFSLRDKVILVTGASSGIGRAISIECSKMGAAVVITGRNSPRLDETYQQLVGKGHIKFVADLSNIDEIVTLVSKIPVLSGIVHCAGIGIRLPFQFCNIEKSRNVVETNLLSPVELSYQLIRQKKYDKIYFSFVFISSISGHIVSSPGNSIYSASKAGLIGLVKGMAVDLASKNIRVNAVLPGMIETPLVEGLEEKVSKEALEQDKKRYPLKCYGKPEDVAYGVIYLLSDAARWITGCNLIIDGGFTLL